MENPRGIPGGFLHILSPVMDMKKRGSWKTYLFWIALTLAVGGLSALLTREGTEAYATTMAKPPLSPPGIVFPIVWTILYVLMGISMARVRLARPHPLRERGTLLYAVQLAFNFCWSIYFFNLTAYGFALAWLAVMWGLILAMVLTFRQVDKTAAYLQIPYLIWVAFAGYLNAGVWLLNG